MTKEIIKAKRKVARKENQFYRIYKKDVIKYIRIKRKKSNEKAKGYQIYRTEGKKWKVIKTIKRGKTVTFVDKKVKKNKVYRYKVRAYGTVKGKKVYGNFGYVCTASLKKAYCNRSLKKGQYLWPGT